MIKCSFKFLLFYSIILWLNSLAQTIKTILEFNSSCKRNRCILYVSYRKTLKGNIIDILIYEQNYIMSNRLLVIIGKILIKNLRIEFWMRIPYGRDKSH